MYKTWSSYAYENIYLKHVLQIKKALNIAGIYSISSSFYKYGSANARGVQIDLLIDRKDQVINLCEIKFYTKEITITREYAESLQKKMDLFQEATSTRKQLFWVLITTFGLKPNEYSLGLITRTLTLDDLFIE